MQKTLWDSVSSVVKYLLKTVTILRRRQMENLIESRIIGTAAVEAWHGGYGIYREFVFLFQQGYRVLHTKTDEVTDENIVGLLLQESKEKVLAEAGFFFLFF